VPGGPSIPWSSFSSQTWQGHEQASGVGCRTISGQRSCRPARHSGSRRRANPYLGKNGDTLLADPTLPMHPATKQYVDNAAAAVVPLKDINFSRHINGKEATAPDLGIFVGQNPSVGNVGLGPTLIPTTNVIYLVRHIEPRGGVIASIQFNITVAGLANVSRIGIWRAKSTSNVLPAGSSSRAGWPGAARRGRGRVPPRAARGAPPVHRDGRDGARGAGGTGAGIKRRVRLATIEHMPDLTEARGREVLSVVCPSHHPHRAHRSAASGSEKPSRCNGQVGGGRRAREAGEPSE
jgi:hypothetical protein